MTSINNYLKGLNIYRSQGIFITLESNSKSDFLQKQVFNFSLV